MTILLYGLNNCDSCRKARKWLSAKGIAHEFVDYRDFPIPAETLKAWAAQMGFANLINKASTTWKTLPEHRRKPGSDPEYVLLLREYPALLKRPLMVRDGRIIQGFSHGQYEKEFADV